jgi:acyl-coenzyme A thioesterase PaaI-like protein
VTNSTPPGPDWVLIPVAPGNAFQDHNLESWARLDGDEPVIGFRVLPQHCNPRKVCHGGLMMTFFDFLLPTLSRFDADADDTFTPTVSITTNFIAPAALGDWLEGRAKTLRRTSSLVFIEGTVRSGDTIVAQASGIFKRRKPDGRLAHSAVLLERMREARRLHDHAGIAP